MSAVVSPKMHARSAWHRIVSVFALVLTLLASAALPTGALAATTYKTYTISSANTPVYSDTALTNRIGAIYGSDEVTVNKVEANYSKVTYPISGGRTKTGYIKTSAILTQTVGYEHVSQTRFTTYRRPDGAKYGAVYAGDKIAVCGTVGSYTQVFYPVSGGYKWAFALTSDVNASKGSSNNGGSSNSVRQRLDQIANGSLRYDSSTNMKLNTKFTGTRSSEQCKGFAKNVFYLCFKVTPGSTQGKPSNYLINGTSGMTRVGYYSSITSSQAQSLFSKARPGDFVQMRRKSSGGSHSAIVYSVSSSGITFFEANTDGKNTVMKNTYTWSQLASKNSGMSLYTASNYSLK